MRFQRLLIIGSASMLGLVLFLGLLLAVLAYSHDRWLPSFVNQFLLSESVADLPADSLHLEQFELESWQRLGKLSLTGPHLSRLDIQGVTWPFSGELIIDRLVIRLPDQLPELLSEKKEPQPGYQSTGAEETLQLKGLTTSTSPATENSAYKNPSATSEPVPAHELTLKKVYNDFFAQTGLVFKQLEALRQQYQLHTLTIRSLQVNGLPLKNAVSLQYFKGDPGFQEGQPYWQFNLTSRKKLIPDQELAGAANLDLRLHLGPDEQRLNLDLWQLDQFVPEQFTLPVWVPVKSALDQLMRFSDQYGLRLIDSNAKLALQMKPKGADIAVNLPAFELQARNDCRLSFVPRTLALGYRVSETGAEQLRFDPGKVLVQDLSGRCVISVMDLPKDSPLHTWIKGLDQDALRQGGQLHLKLEEPLTADLGTETLKINGLKIGWQPKEAVSASLQLALSDVKLTPKKLTFGLESRLKADLKPQPLFANQSRQIALSMQMTSDIGWDLTRYLPGKQVQAEASSMLRDLRMEIQASELTLSPAPNDNAVLWAPSRFEMPLFQHDGRWTVELRQPQHPSGRWHLIHKGQGEAFVRYPGLKRNVRVPYQAELDLKGTLGTLKPESLIKEMVGNLDWKLIDGPSRTAGMADSPFSLLPQLKTTTRIDAGKIANDIAAEVELERVSEWLALPAGTLINDGQLSVESATRIDKEALISGAELAETDKLLSQLSSRVTLNLSQLTGEAKGYEFGGVNLPLQLMLSKGDLNLEPTTLKIARFFVGVELTDLNADLNASASLKNVGTSLKGRLTDFSAQTLGGHIQMARLDYPFTSSHTSDLILEKLDLSQLIALGEKQIKVTGLLNGRLPLRLSQKGVAIHKGRVKSDEGEIVLKNNPAWQSMLQQQPVLASQLKHLNQLHYTVLQGDVEMEESGQLIAILQIKGENRAEDQPVTLNFTSEQNILTLLKALRLSDQIDKSLSESAQRMYQ